MVGIAGSGDPSVPKLQRIDDGFREFIEAQKVFFVANRRSRNRSSALVSISGLISTALMRPVVPTCVAAWVKSVVGRWSGFGVEL
jgi:hypothetical protein